MSGTDISVLVGDRNVVLALDRFTLSLQQNEELMREIGASQLLSVRRTFREQGVPAGSWVPLSPNTIRRNPKLYGAGHKLLILRGMLLNSITFRTIRGGVVIGTSLKYAAVHQFGSRDRGVAIGPQTEAESKETVYVGPHTRAYTRELGTGKLGGRTRRIQGPLNRRTIAVMGHTRHQNIPPRPYLVIRPEDPARIRGIAVAYIDRARKSAGLGGAS
jgi:phage gpG-like protein